MATAVKTTAKKTTKSTNPKVEKISKLAKAIKKGSLKGVVVELVDDPWNLKATKE
jgi:hypothetical protein